MFYVTLMDISGQVHDEKELYEANESLRLANERLEIITALSNDVLFDIQCGTGEANVYGDFVGVLGANRSRKISLFVAAAIILVPQYHFA